MSSNAPDSEPILAEAAAELGIDLATVSPKAEQPVRDLLKGWIRIRDDREVVDRKCSMRLMGCGLTSQIERELNGDIDAFLDGATRKITTRSIFRYQIRRVIETYPIDQPAKRGRNPVAGFKRTRRLPTAAELQALARANQQRHLAAEQRRAEADARRHAREDVKQI